MMDFPISFIVMPLILGGIVSAVLAVFVSIAASRMQRLDSYGLAVTGSIMAMLPIHPLFFISLPLGLWALITLLRPEVKAAFTARQLTPPPGGPAEAWPIASAPHFDQASVEEVSRAQGQVTGPVIGMLVGALLNAMILGGIFVAITVESTRNDGDLIAQLIMLLPIPIAYAVYMIAGCVAMRCLRWYPMAVVAAILSMIPFAPAWLISLPFGIWAIVVLTRARVRSAFGRQAAPPGIPPEKRFGPDYEAIADRAQGRLIGPVVGVMVGGILNALLGGVILVPAIAESPGDDWFPFALLLIVPVLYAVTVIAAAVCMRVLRAYPLAAAGAILALIPLGPGWLVSMPFGLWALIALTRWDVRRAFP